MRILIVDDNAEITELLTAEMELLGHEVDFAGNGIDAIRMIEHSICDVVITDGHMPVMTGFDLCRYIRSRFQQIYIIGLSGALDLDEFRHAGADIYFRKPFKFRSLQQAIEDKLNSEPDEAAQTGC